VKTFDDHRLVSNQTMKLESPPFYEEGGFFRFKLGF
jgi:hypothetical protein